MLAGYILQVVNGYRLQKPTRCPDEMYRIVERCWHAVGSGQLLSVSTYRLLSHMSFSLFKYINERGFLRYPRDFSFALCYPSFNQLELSDLARIELWITCLEKPQCERKTRARTFYFNVGVVRLRIRAFHRSERSDYIFIYIYK